MIFLIFFKFFFSFNYFINKEKKIKKKWDNQEMNSVWIHMIFSELFQFKDAVKSIMIKFILRSGFKIRSLQMQWNSVRKNFQILPLQEKKLLITAWINTTRPTIYSMTNTQISMLHSNKSSLMEEINTMPLIEKNLS